MAKSTEKEVKVEEICTDCKGTGLKTESVICPTCAGTGKK